MRVYDTWMIYWSGGSNLNKIMGRISLKSKLPLLFNKDEFYIKCVPKFLTVLTRNIWVRSSLKGMFYKKNPNVENLFT